MLGFNSFNNNSCWGAGYFLVHPPLFLNLFTILEVKTLFFLHQFMLSAFMMTMTYAIYSWRWVVISHVRHSHVVTCESKKKLPCICYLICCIGVVLCGNNEVPLVVPSHYLTVTDDKSLFLTLSNSGKLVKWHENQSSNSKLDLQPARKN